MNHSRVAPRAIAAHTVRRHRPLHRFGAIAMTLHVERPEGAGGGVTISTIERCACATSNGVEVYGGDLFAPLPRELEGSVDVVVGVVPYVPTGVCRYCRATRFVFESTLSYDGGEDGRRRSFAESCEKPEFLRPGGALCSGTRRRRGATVGG